MSYWKQTQFDISEHIKLSSKIHFDEKNSTVLGFIK